MRWLRSLRGDLRYVAWGDYGSLIPILDYLTGVRGHLETRFLGTAAAATNRQRQLPVDAQLALQATVALGDDAGLLLYTGYYKDTWFVGPVRGSASGAVFAKSYKLPDAAELERSRADTASTLTSDPNIKFLSPGVAGSAVLYPIVKRVRRSSQLDALRVGLSVNEASLERRQPPIDWHARVDAACRVLEEELHVSSTSVRETRWGVDWTMAHGDLAPWNIIAGPNRTLTVIDYERVGPRPQLYDFVYAATHGPALRGARSWDTRLLARPRLASADADSTRSSDRHALVRQCLSVSLVEAIEDLASHPENRRRLTTLVMSKRRFLEQI